MLMLHATVARAASDMDPATCVIVILLVAMIIGLLVILRGLLGIRARLE